MRVEDVQFAWQGHGVADPRRVRVLLPLAILAATFLAYADTLALGFVYDDHVLIVNNDSIRSWRYFPGYFASHIWSFRYPHLLANYYRPFFLTWLRLNDMFFGLRPWGWHLTSVLAHVVVTYLVYRLALKLTDDEWVAGAAGLLFGLHPVHVEAVADITSIQEPLSTLFTLGALLTFWRTRQASRKLAWLAASLALTAAALLSKESALVLPFLISAYVWTYAGDSSAQQGQNVALPSQPQHEHDAPAPTRDGLFGRLRPALVAAFPFWVVILAYVPLRIRALKGFAHVVTPVSLSREFFTIPSVLFFYARLLVWPSGLSCYYDTPYISSPSWQGFVLPAALLAVIAAVLAGWYGRTRRALPVEANTIAFVGLWMFLTLLPVLNFRYLPEKELAHDRYVYLPSVGFVLLVALALRQAMRGVAQPLRRPAWALLGALVIAGVLGTATAWQNLFWSDDVTLNYRAHAVAPHNVYATTSLAAAVAQRGMEAQAMVLYQQALAIQPNFWRANVNVAYLYYAHGNFPEAVRYFARACSADPTDGDQFLYLGMALLQMGRPDEAEKAVRAALLARPHGKNYHLGLAMVLRQEGQLLEAKREVGTALVDDPQNAQARNLLDEITRQMNPPAEKALAVPQPSDRSAVISPPKP